MARSRAASNILCAVGKPYYAFYASARNTGLCPHLKYHAFYAWMFIPIIIIVLLLATTSYFEPVLFLIVVGVSILLNLGTNAFIGEVSFATQSMTTALQLAISMDYSIFLLHRFGEERKQGLNVEEAM